MAFDYEKVSEKLDDDLTGHWASYSDLFMVMSTIFLMCYAVAKLYGSSSIIQQQGEYRKIERENEDLKEQIKVYSTLREDYIKTGASKEEQKVYTELMDKLSLLQEEAKKEKEDLRAQANENQKKEVALNKYQQLIRNIINANLVASARIKTRDDIIDKRDTALDAEQEKLQVMRSEMESMQNKIRKGQQKIADVKEQLAQRREELQHALEEQQISKTKFNESIQRLEQQTQAEVARLKAQNSKVASQLEKTTNTLTQAQRDVQELEKQRESLQGQTRALASEKQSLLSETQNLKGQAQALRGHAAQLRSQNQNLQGEYDKVKAIANARRDLADRIKQNFSRAGVNAEVDRQTGDVTISFGNEYFDTDRARLKPRMTDILKQTIPIYSRSLFEDPKISKKIKAVEIVGFASPTYKGKLVDPVSLSADDRTAVNYNMDLSYRRAREIFEYIFDPAKMSYENQERLLPLVKVTGRSYLSERLDRATASSSTSVEDYCAKFDCKQAQKVIIRFNLGE